jgi:cell division protein FtsW
MARLGMSLGGVSRRERRTRLAFRESGRMRRRELDSRLLILVTLALVAFGLVMVYSATSAAAAVGGKDPSYYLKRQGIYAALGIVMMVMAQRWDYRRLRALAPPLVLGSLVLLVAVLVIGPAINGARRWISLGPAVFQPSELAKLAVAIWAAAYLSRNPAPRDLRELWRPIGALSAVFCVLLILEPDMGTAIALLVMLIGMLLVAGTPTRTLAAGVSIAAALGTIAIYLEPYRRARFFAFLHPWKDAQGTGFQIVQAMIGMGSGHFFGVGLGQGVQKIFYLPEAHTDMMLANIGEELGLLGVAAVIGAYALFAYAGLDIATRCKDPFGKRLATGLTVLVCGQAAINILAVMGSAPLTGIPLPFLSYGGSSLVVLLAGVGILLNIAHRGGAAAASVPDRSRGNGRSRAAVARSRGSADRARRARDVRRVAGSRRSAARS